MTQLGESAPKPKRFYDVVAAIPTNDRFEIRLDDKTAKTPKRAPLATPHAALADAVAKEWDAMDDVIDTAQMPLTKLLSTFIDLHEEARADWIGDVVKFLQTDLVCYRATEPAALVERQLAIWTPYVDAFEARFGVRLEVTSGIMAVTQRQQTIQTTEAWLASQPGDVLLGVKTATEIAGSAVLGLMLAEHPTTPEDIFNASRVDEHFQEERWGVDGEARAREEALKSDFLAAARFLSIVKG